MAIGAKRVKFQDSPIVQSSMNKSPTSVEATPAIWLLVLLRLHPELLPVTLHPVDLLLILADRLLFAQLL